MRQDPWSIKAGDSQSECDDKSAGMSSKASLSLSLSRPTESVRPFLSQKVVAGGHFASPSVSSSAFQYESRLSMLLSRRQILDLWG